MLYYFIYNNTIYLQKKGVFLPKEFIGKTKKGQK